MWQILIVLGILLLFFGPSRLEKLGPALGKAIRGFKKGLDDPDFDSKTDSKTESKSEVAKEIESPNGDLPKDDSTKKS